MKAPIAPAVVPPIAPAIVQIDAQKALVGLDDSKLLDVLPLSTP
ncbi:hypothetical protein [Mycobacterium sp. 1165196.3]|nr:hypothetical protein [Mycobacterium sp. 1165196.3]